MPWSLTRAAASTNCAASRLPAGVTPTMGPDASGVGWVYQYAIQSNNMSLADLRSRLLAIPTIAVLPPDEGLIGAILVKLFADRQTIVGEDVLTYLLSRIERSFAAAGSVVDRLDRAALAAGRRITVPLARQVLEG